MHAQPDDDRDPWLGPWRGPWPPRVAWVYAGAFTLTIHTVMWSWWMMMPTSVLAPAALRQLLQGELVGHTLLANVRAAAWVGVRLGLLTAACVAAVVPLRLGVASLVDHAALASTADLQFIAAMATAMVPLALCGSLLTAVGFRWEPARAD